MSSSSDLSSFSAIPPHCPPHPVLARGRAGLLQHQQFCPDNKLLWAMRSWKLVTSKPSFSSNVDACKVLALTTITAVSVCLSVLLEHRSTVYAGTGSFACGASLSLLLCFLITYFWRYLQHDKIICLTQYHRNITESYWVSTHSYPYLPGQNFIRTLKTLERVKISQAFCTNAVF